MSYRIIRIFTTIAVISVTASIASAQTRTPVEKVISEYADVKGARDFIASGGEMIMARSLIRKTPLAAIASDVDVLAVLKMQNASENEIDRFEKELGSALSHYEYFGKENSRNGTVDVYIKRAGQDSIEELVIYNPGLHSVNSLKGSLSVSKLMQIHDHDL